MLSRSIFRAQLQHRGSSGFGSGYAPSSRADFSALASALKRRYRGKGQYEFARKAAQDFLRAEVPTTAVNIWVEQGCNALALAQLVNFFEIQTDPYLESLIVQKLCRVIDDGAAAPQLRLQASIAVFQMPHLRVEEYVSRIFANVEAILSHPANMGSWEVLEGAAKVMQRGGQRSPAHLIEMLARLITAQLLATPPKEFSFLQVSLLRCYSWLVRVGRYLEAGQVLHCLVECSGDFHSYDFSTLVMSCTRHHAGAPLDVQLLHRIARASLTYSTVANCRDVASILSSLVKLVGSLEVGKGGVTQRDMSELTARLYAVLEEYEGRVLRFMCRTDDLFWSTYGDVTAVVFAFESGGRRRHAEVFRAYAGYVAEWGANFEPPQLAMAAGILRRAELLAPAVAELLARRIESVLGEFNLAEISHICSTFAALPSPPEWMGEAKAVAARLLSPDSTSNTRLTLAAAFPHDETLHSVITYGELTPRQLTDAVMITKETRFEEPLHAELARRLRAAQESFSPDDLELIFARGAPGLGEALTQYLVQRFAAPEWSADTLYSLPLLRALEASGGHGAGIAAAAKDPRRALDAAMASAVSPEQFVSLVELLGREFGETDDGIVSFAVAGGKDLLTADKVLMTTVVRYLTVVAPFPRMRPSHEWLSFFTDRMLRRIGELPVEQLANFLVCLRSFFHDVERTPQLEPLLRHAVTGTYTALTAASPYAAPLTATLMLLQHGSPQPVIQETSPLLAMLRANHALPADMREVLAQPIHAASAAAMVPQAPPTAPATRFSPRVRRVAPPPSSGVSAPTEAAAAQQSTASLDLSDGDPFAAPPAPTVVPPVATAASAPQGPPPSEPPGTPIAADAPQPPHGAAAAATEEVRAPLTEVETPSLKGLFSRGMVATLFKGGLHGTAAATTASNSGEVTATATATCAASTPMETATVASAAVPVVDHTVTSTPSAAEGAPQQYPVADVEPPLPTPKAAPEESGQPRRAWSFSAAQPRIVRHPRLVNAPREEVAGGGAAAAAAAPAAVAEPTGAPAPPPPSVHPVADAFGVTPTVTGWGGAAPPPPSSWGSAAGLGQWSSTPGWIGFTSTPAVPPTSAGIRPGATGSVPEPQPLTPPPAAVAPPSSAFVGSTKTPLRYPSVFAAAQGDGTMQGGDVATGAYGAPERGAFSSPAPPATPPAPSRFGTFGVTPSQPQRPPAFGSVPRVHSFGMDGHRNPTASEAAPAPFPAGAPRTPTPPGDFYRGPAAAPGPGAAKDTWMNGTSQPPPHQPQVGGPARPVASRGFVATKLNKAFITKVGAPGAVKPVEAASTTPRVSPPVAPPIRAPTAAVPNPGARISGNAESTLTAYRIGGRRRPPPLSPTVQALRKEFEAEEGNGSGSSPSDRHSAAGAKHGKGRRGAGHANETPHVGAKAAAARGKVVGSAAAGKGKKGAAAVKSTPPTPAGRGNAKSAKRGGGAAATSATGVSLSGSTATKRTAGSSGAVAAAPSKKAAGGKKVVVPAAKAKAVKKAPVAAATPAAAPKRNSGPSAAVSPSAASKKKLSNTAAPAPASKKKLTVSSPSASASASATGKKKKK